MCKENHLLQHYRLVIVGHSLGAGVASILAILLKDYFPDLICYAYSPPGCVFRYAPPTTSLSLLRHECVQFVPRAVFHWYSTAKIL